MIVVLILVGFLLALAVGVGLAAHRTRALTERLHHAERDVAEARAAAEDERAQRELLSESLRASTDGIVVVDASGARFVRNAAAERFSHARHADALAEEVIDELLGGALRGMSGERELQLFGPPREVLHVTAMPLRADGSMDGRILGAAAFVRDVSDHRRVESVRRDFVANVSHELKTPIGALALLAETMAGSDEPEVMQQLAQRVLREADRLGRIVDDLLDLSIIEAQESPTRDSAPVRGLLEEAAERVRAFADVSDIPLRVASAPSHLVVTCDRVRILSALTNLLDNAVKYSEAGNAVELEANAEGDHVVITVRDHGIGIPSRDLERIFERFYRVDRARSRDTGGTGLGLSIVRHVAQAHGGDVTVESREGEGSTFRIRLPLAAGALRSVPHPDDPPSSPNERPHVQEAS